MNAELTAEVRAFYDTYIHRYSTRDYSGLMSMFDKKNMSAIGGGTNYVLYEMDHFSKEMLNDFAQVPGTILIDTTFYHCHFLDHRTAIITTVTKWVVPIGETHWIGVPRMVFVARKNDDCWKVNHVSISVPMAQLDDHEHFPLKEIEERNRILQE